MQTKFCFADFFAGAGGLSLGFEMTESFAPIYAVDSNNNATRTYAENRKHLAVRILESKISSVSAGEVVEEAKARGFSGVDLIVAGPPCRPYSNANRSRAKRWTKAELPDEFRDLLDLILEIEPKVVVIENVPTLARVGDGAVVQLIKNELLPSYQLQEGTLNALNFGVPQNRRRYFIVAALKRAHFDGPLLPEGSGTTDLRVRDAISDLPPIKGVGVEEMEYMPSEAISAYASRLRNSTPKLYDHQVHRPAREEVERFRFIGRGSSLHEVWKQAKIPKNLVLNTYSLKTMAKVHANIYRRLSWSEPSCTITHVRKSVLIHPDKRQNRLISVREAARVQSFPDSYRFSQAPLGSKYQQVADAVPPLLARALAVHLEKILIGAEQAQRFVYLNR